MFRKLTLTIIAAAALGAALSTAAFADRVYSSVEACKASCHGTCFMHPDGGLCVWGALPAKRDNRAKVLHGRPVPNASQPRGR
jgi:hypothetical protein